MLKKLVLISMALGLLGLMAGCSDNATGTEDNTSTLNLQSEFGGYTATSEVLADADLINEEEGTREFDDPMLSLSANLCHVVPRMQWPILLLLISIFQR